MDIIWKTAYFARACYRIEPLSPAQPFYVSFSYTDYQTYLTSYFLLKNKPTSLSLVFHPMFSVLLLLASYCWEQMNIAADTITSSKAKVIVMRQRHRRLWLAECLFAYYRLLLAFTALSLVVLRFSPIRSRCSPCFRVISCVSSITLWMLLIFLCTWVSDYSFSRSSLLSTS